MRRLFSPRAALVVAAVLGGAHCSAPPAPPRPADRIVGWQRVAAFSGRGNIQTQTFKSDTGEFRVKWAAVNESAPGRGTLRVQFRSGDSGRVIMEPVDHTGAGSGTVQIADDVRWYYLTVESQHVDWSVEIEEPIIGHTVPRSDP